MPNPDAIRLRHMREAAAAALEMAAGRTRSEPRSQHDVEDGAHPLPGTRGRFPSIPFAKTVSMRNHLIHAYFDVDLNIVWTTVVEELPTLLPALDSALVEIEK